MSETPQAVHLKDYQPPSFFVEKIDLYFDLRDEHTIVSQKAAYKKNPENLSNVLHLDGEELELIEIKINGKELLKKQFEVSETSLRILDLKSSEFVLELKTKIKPQENFKLEGLYQSNNMFCTQCEAEGFRRITYFQDRPDVLANYTVTVEADREKYPVLLSNGNKVDQGDFGQERHWATWDDPFPKPCYLFALVAGNLHSHEGQFTTMSGKEVQIKIYVEHQNAHKCEFAMKCVLEAMKWDEERFGREYDLDTFMIVAVDDFNAGAMENKGLNIFNSKCVLATPDTSTDADFLNIQGIIGHEYFHNWSGNRVTLRDWFQLSLKEGLTIFRDQEFSSDMNSRPVERIKNVQYLRSAQFSEDSGPMAHPVRPESYIEINNFYTVTVYEKGGEVVRMLHTLLGEKLFRQALDLYFDRYDGSAVTIEDFVQSMEGISGRDLTQFKLWYSQAGTPVLKVEKQWDEDNKKLILNFKQNCPDTPNQNEKAPFTIPVNIGFLKSDGEEAALEINNTEKSVFVDHQNVILEVNTSEQSVEFPNLEKDFIPSILRGFSAPVKVEFDYTDDELATIAIHDPDSFNRWEANQNIYTKVVLGFVDLLKEGKQLKLPEHLVDIFGKNLNNPDLDPAFKALILSIPKESFFFNYIGKELEPLIIHQAREFLLQELAKFFRSDLQKYFYENQEEQYFFNGESVAKRSFKNLCLSLLASIEEQDIYDRIYQQFSRTNIMNDRIIALSCLVNSKSEKKEEALQEFYQQWENDPNVLDKWFTIQAFSKAEGAFDRIEKLRKHEKFNIKNPNRVRSLIGAFSAGNIPYFHQEDGEGYQFLADTVLELNEINPMVAARLLTPLTQWKKFSPKYGDLMKEQLNRILSSKKKLSKDVFEITSKSVE